MQNAWNYQSMLSTMVHGHDFSITTYQPHKLDANKLTMLYDNITSIVYDQPTSFSRVF